MKLHLFSLVFLAAAVGGLAGKKLPSESLPTVYDFYASPAGVNRTGLTAEPDGFKLNGKPIRIASGSIHYFRVHPAYWRDRLRRLRAAGANAVDTYTSWNLHEMEKDSFDFGNGTNEMSEFLDVRRFIQIAQEEDLLVIIRPGPYICSEFEFGAMPSWLLRDPNMKVRSNYPGYLDRVKIYFSKLLPLVRDLQWQHGGSIIMVQIENEFGAFGSMEKEHLETLKELLLSHGINETFFTSDSPFTARDNGAIPGVLQTANFRFTPRLHINTLLQLQPNKPVFIAELWSGWYDYLMESHSHVTATEFNTTLEIIFGEYNGSINSYMFHGGTNFGFLNGANSLPLFPYYKALTTSYDYDSPLSESGRYKDKYFVFRDLVEKYTLANSSVFRPDMPAELNATAYPSVPIQGYLSFDEIVNRVPSSQRTVSPQPISMENLPINNDSGQSYGFTLYRKNLTLGNNSTITMDKVYDQLTVLVDGERQTHEPIMSASGLLTEFGYWYKENQTLQLSLLNTTKPRALDLLVESWGRVNFGGPPSFLQRKGIFNQTIRVDDVPTENWEIVALEFKKSWIQNLSGFHNVSNVTAIPNNGPVMIQSVFNVETPQDTFLDMSEWFKGVVFVNGFNLGKYFKAGPQQTMYLPGPLLNTGRNTITIFETVQVGPKIVFTTTENLGPSR